MNSPYHNALELDRVRNARKVKMVLLEETAPGDLLQFQCQECQQVMTEGVVAHAGIHGAGGIIMDTATATRKR